ncbi:DUF2809 domain-containing protein [Dysgonomonas sp. 216]|uniref:ribosomal maturation YjgA family protein n=1 Tax=Dysgonomonas sp. 216 TaxID=2302934 RepID=UPI0013D10715|nr:DUF2809 domain-containing protein [Dysgonomonas sp. 216]NDW18541.1 DUF2809 domain-containing protein [Dysgonomonas sp. 216]
MKLTFNSRAFLLFIIILVIEVIIALFVKDDIIRPYVGDILVVMLMFYFVRSFINTKFRYIVVGVLLFAYLIEFFQYLGMVDILGVADNPFLRTVLGSTFSWGDIACYSIGALICYFIERESDT